MRYIQVSVSSSFRKDKVSDTKHADIAAGVDIRKALTVWVVS